MIILWTFLIVALVVLISLWFDIKRKTNFWTQQNVELIKFRSFIRNAKGKNFGLAIADIYHDMCKTHSACKAIEVPLLSAVIVRDQQMIKDVLHTHFESFPDRGLYVNFKDPLSMSLGRFQYDDWKRIRQTLSPSFTPAKTKSMLPTVLSLSQRLVEFLNQECETDQSCELDVSDVCARFTTDLMIQLIYGIEGRSFTEPHNEFREYGKRSFIQFATPWKNVLGVKFPKLMRFLNIHMFDKESNVFFTRVFKECAEMRERNSAEQHDILSILINMKRMSEESGDCSITWGVLASQAHSLFVGGFESSACAMGYALYELAKSPQMQIKAREEIFSVLAKYDQQFTHESLKDMEYINQIVNETLRKYPVVVYMTRFCRRTCTVRTSDGSVTIKPGTFIILPYYGIHHNPDYYPEPEQFRPERFAEEEAASRPNCPFMAFGDGPRMCIGELFGKLQMALGLAMLLSHFRFSFGEKTPSDLEFDPNNDLLLSAKGGVHLRVDKLK